MRCVTVLCLVLGLLAETRGQGSATWNCDTLTPNLASLRNEPPSPPATSPFHVAVSSNSVQAGQTVSVQLAVPPPGQGEITGFIIQMRTVGSNTPQGTWIVPANNEHAQVKQCGEHEADTAVNSRLFAVQIHELTWRAPDNVPEGYTVQIVGSAIDGSVGEYWNLHGNAVVQITVTTATVVTEDGENEETNPDENDGGDQNTGGEQDPQVTSLDAEDEHDLLLETAMEQEYLQKKQADIAMENLNSETDNTLEEEQKQREQEYKWEMEDFEKKRYDEEMRRQARIDAELRDKEEWDAQQAEEERLRLEEEERRKQERREMLGDTLQEVDINEIDEGEKKTSAGHRQTSIYALYTFFIIVLASLL